MTDFSFVREGDLETVSTPIDFLGANYYARHHVTADPAPSRPGLSLFTPAIGAMAVVPEGMQQESIGWTNEPDGLGQLLRRLHRDYTQGRVPIYVTESGTACDDYVDPEGEVDDHERIDYLDAHIRAMRGAMDDGVDVRGYFVWSPTDNFEWSFGYSKRFGLVYVDYATQRRTPKKSFFWYRDVISRNAPPKANRRGAESGVAG